MKHQVHFGTDSGIVSMQAAMQIRALIDDLARTVDILEADMAVGLPRVGGAIDLDTRRHNLRITIAVLEDRLGSIEKMRSREDAARAHTARPH